jgi:glycosyltransferase involved in cell wall biosynthesis
MPDAPDTPFVSVIVPVFNDAVRVTRCASALERQTYPPDQYEVIVVDNGSAVPVHLGAGFPHVRVEREPTAQVNAARVKGLDVARGDVLAFTDADCEPDERWLERGVAALVRLPRCGLVAGRVEMTIDSARRPGPAAVLSACLDLRQDRLLAGGHWAAFANVFSTRAVVASVGTMDPRLASSGEVEWGRRIHEAGWLQQYAPDAVVRHPARTSMRAMCRRTVRLESGWRQLRGRGIGRGVRHALGQYVYRPALAIYRDVLANARFTRMQRMRAAGLGVTLIAVRLAARGLMSAGWRPDLRRHWG